MDGEEAIGALGADPRLQVAVAEGATNRIAEDRSWLPSELDGKVQRVIDRVTYTVAGWLTSAPEPPPLRDSIVRAAPRPVLLVAAGNVPDEQAAAELMRTTAPTSVTVWVAPKANHTGALRAQPALWIQQVMSFLDAALLRASINGDRGVEHSSWSPASCRPPSAASHLMWAISTQHSSWNTRRTTL